MGSRPRPAWPAFFATPARVSSKRFRNHGILLPLLVSLTALSGMQRKSWIRDRWKKSYCRQALPLASRQAGMPALQIRTRLVVTAVSAPRPAHADDTLGSAEKKSATKRKLE